MKLVKKDKKAKNARILGSESFVNRVLKEAELGIKQPLPVKQMERKIEDLKEKTCKEENILTLSSSPAAERGNC